MCVGGILSVGSRVKWCCNTTDCDKDVASMSNCMRLLVVRTDDRMSAVRQSVPRDVFSHNIYDNNRLITQNTKEQGV